MTTSVAWRTGALGDFVLTLPALSRLADDGPVTVVAPPRYRALFPAAAAWIDSDGLEAARWIAGAPPAVRFDRGVAWTRTGAEALRQVCAVVREGAPRPPAGRHAADHLFDALGLGPRDRDPHVTPVGAPWGRAGAVAIAPGAGAGARRWPLDRWRRVADALPHVVWVGGPLETHEAWPAPRVDPPDPGSLARLAAEVGVWLGPDSGPSHLAAAVGTPTGVVFTGASDPRSWAPIGATVLNSEDEVVRFALTRPTS